MDDKGKCPHEVLGSDCRANCDGDCICTGDCGTCAAGCLPTLERCCTNCGATFESVRADDATCKKCLLEFKDRLYRDLMKARGYEEYYKATHDERGNLYE